MGIFAQKAGSVSLVGLLDNVVNTNPDDGDILVWNDEQQAFVVQAPSDNTLAPTTTNTYGGTNAITVDGGISAGVLNFKELKAGSGVSLSQTSSDVTITNTLSANLLSVDGSYRITIDNDNSSTDAKFDIYTSRSSVSNPVTISFTPTVASTTITNVYTTNDGFGVFETRDGFDFVAAGFTAGQYLEVTNAGSQTGSYQINDVTNTTIDGVVYSRIELTTAFTGTAALNLGGPKENVVFTQIELFAASSTRLLAVTADFGVNGYDLQTDMNITISGTDSFDGTYTIDSIVDKGTDAFEHSEIVLSATTTLTSTGNVIPSNLTTPAVEIDVAVFEESTGFYVLEDGTMHSTTARADNQPTSANHLTRKDYVDTQINSILSNRRSENLIGDTNASGADLMIVNGISTDNAVNWFEMANSVAGEDLELRAQGPETDINIQLEPKNSGYILTPAIYNTDLSTSPSNALVNRDYVVNRGGWAYYVDNARFTEGNALSIAADTRTQLLNDGAHSLSNYQQINDMSGFWNTTTNKIQPLRVGDAYDLRLTFNVKTSTVSSTGWVELELEIDPGNVIYQHIVHFTKGTNLTHGMAFSIPIFTSSEFFSGGGTMYFNSNVDITLWSVKLLAIRTYTP